MAPDRWVILDDQDSDITYVGNWFRDSGSKDNTGNFGPPYLHTLHGTSADGSVTFKFNGTAIGVWGTSILSNPKTNPDPSLECFVDNVSIGSEPPFEFAENNWKLCGKVGLSDGLHTLRIDVKVQSPQQTFWLDQIGYIPSPSMPLDNKTIMLDNTDPAIRLDASWKPLGGTANMTTSTNSVALVDFVGTSVSWVAFIPTELPHNSTFGTYMVDNGESVKFSLQGLPADGKTTVYNQFYFTTPEVEAGPHTLTVTFLGTGQTTPLCLDYLYVKNGTFPVADSSNGTKTPEPQPSVSSQASSDGGSSGQNIGAILGGVLGGLAFLIICAGALLFWRRRNRPQDKFVETREPEFISTPFNHYNDHRPPIPGMMAPGSYSSVPSGSAVEIVPTPPSNRPQMGTLGKWREAFGRGGELAWHPSGGSHGRSDSSASSSWPQTATSGAEGNSVQRLHTDSGIRLNQPLIEDVPPHYTPD